MKRLQKSVIAIVLVMCLLFSEMATLISYAIESHDSNFDFIENELNQSTEESIDKTEPITEIDLTISEDTIYTLEENKVNFTLVLKNTSPENELFENPIIEIELPEEIEKAKIDKVMMLYKNGLSISKWDVKEENSKKYLHIELEGIQTEYQNSSIIDGTNVIIQTTLKPYETTPIKESTFKLRYENSNKNIDYVQEEKECKEYDIQFMSRYGLLTLNGIENLSIENEKELAIGKSLETIDLDIESNAQILNHEMAIVNNYTESLKDVEIIGNIATENNENLLEQNLENTFTSTLLTTINTQGVENQVYYSDEINPSKDSNTWTQNYEELENISSYKIDIQNLNPGEILKFDYQTQTPENLSYNQTIYSNYEVNYVYDNQEQTEKSMVQAKTEEKEAIYEDCQIQEEIEGLDFGIYASKGGKELKENQEIHEGQIIRYSLVLTNNTLEDIENISIDTKLVNGNFYELKVLGPDEFMGDPFLEFTDYFENTSKENNLYNIDKLAAGEEITLDIDAVIRNKNENESDTINLNCKVKKDSEEYEFSSISNKIINSKINLHLGYGGTENVEVISESIFKLDLELFNIDIEDINQVDFQLDVPSIFKIDKTETEERNDNLQILNISKKDDRQICTFRITELEKGNKNEFVFMGMLGEIDLEFPSINSSFVCSADYENETYISNNYIKTIHQNETNLKVEFISNKTANDFVYDKDEIVYDLIIENTGSIDTDVNIILPIPNGVEYDKFEIYINDELVEEKEIEEYYLRLNQLIKANEKLDLRFKVKVNESLFKYNQEEIKVYAEINSNNLKSKIITEEIIFYIENEDKLDNKIEEDQELLPDSIEDEAPEQIGNSNIIDIETIDKIKDEINNNPDNKPNDKPNDDSDDSDKEKPEDNNQNDNSSKPNKPNQDDENSGIIEDEQKVYGNISGAVWADMNKDGLKDNLEKKLSGIKVKLYKNSEEISKETCISEVKTNDNGEYNFKNLSTGTYIVVFEYDSKTYDVTEYAVNSVSDENSKGLQKDVNGKIVAVTNTIVVNGNNVENINLGLIEKSDFDLKIDKTISSITVKNGKDDRTTNYNNEKIIKEEITAKYLGKTDVTITYKIKISNIGSISGYVNKIEDYIPEGLEFNENLNEDWYLNNNILVNTSLSNLELQPGQSKEISLVLTKKLTEESLGTYKNKAGIAISSNYKKIEDSNSSNNESEVSLIISISTGKLVICSILSVIVLLIGGGIIFSRKSYLNKLNIKRKI